jgi:hypothetical protein
MGRRGEGVFNPLGLIWFKFPRKKKQCPQTEYSGVESHHYSDSQFNSIIFIRTTH